MGRPIYRVGCTCVFRTRHNHLLNFLDQMEVVVPCLMPGTPPQTLIEWACRLVDVGDTRFTAWARTEALRWRHFMVVEPANGASVVISAPESEGGLLGVEC